jgi:nitrate/nitrite transporter NarK
MAMMIFFSLPTRFIGGLIADRLSINNLKYVKTTAYFLQGFSILLFLLHPTDLMVYIWFILFGLGQGFSYTISPLMRARFFGRKAIGSIQGVASMFMVPFGFLAPIYAGWVYDTTQSYNTLFIQSTVLLGVATLITLFLSPPKPPAEITDIGKIV